jgi:hypothetical protein
MDYALEISNRRCWSRAVVLLNGGAFRWTSKQHEVVAMSTTEAEYATLS